MSGSALWPARRGTALAALSVTAAGWTLAAPPALAGDGAYGRLDGDVSVAAEVGVGATFPGEALSTRGALHYLGTVGLYGHYADSLGGGAQPVRRSFAGGVELRPLFLARFVSNLERGPAYWDLFIDSLALRAGTFSAQWPERRCPEPATEPCWVLGLELGLGLELPLLAQVNGPFIALHLSERWPTDYGDEGLLGPGGHGEVGGQASPTSMVSLTLGYRHLFETGLVSR